MTVQATAVWRVRPSGNNANGGGYDPGIGGAATDYSRQNAAQATGTNGSGSGTTTFTDATAANFTSAMIGNAINISGQGFYFVTSFTSATQVVVDRALGTFSGASWKLGGGWADLWTNVTTSGPLVPGNIVYVLGSGTPNPSSYVYDYTFAGAGTATSPVNGNNSAGWIQFVNDTDTPGYKAAPDTTGGMPTIKSDGAFMSGGFNAWQGLWFVLSNNTGGTLLAPNNNAARAFGCVFDAAAFPITCCDFSQGAGNIILGCEAFSSTGGGSAATQAFSASGNCVVCGCNVHDYLAGSGAIRSVGNATNVIIGNIVSKCSADGIRVSVGGCTVVNNTIDGNGNNGITISSQSNLSSVTVFNNIISNHTAGGAFGISVGAGTAAANDLVEMFVDYNSYYNNTANYNAIDAGPHDTALGSSPYVGQSTENYTLA